MVEVCFTDPQLGGHPAQLAAVAFAADDAGFRMLRDHQAGNIAAVFGDALVGGLNNHVSGRGRDASGHEAPGFFIFHQTHSAGAEWFKVRVVAEFGNFYAVLLSSL